MNSLLAAAAGVALVAGVTVASAQGLGGGGPGGGQHMRQGSGGGAAFSGGGRGGGFQAPGRAGGLSQSPGRSFGGGAAHAQTGRSFAPQHAQTSRSFGPQHAMRGERGRTGMQAAHAQRGPGLREQRTQQRRMLGQNLRTTTRGQNLKTTSRGQNLRTTSRTGTQTGVTSTQRGTKGFAQAGTRSRISITSQQRTRIHRVALQTNVLSRFRVTNVNFNIHIGFVIPRSFHLFVIPEDIVFIVPQFRHFRFFVFDDELVIVDPFTFEIVAIIPV
jgi:hypothetical protein